MQSTAEINEEKYAEKIAAIRAKMQKAIADGLNHIESLDQDKVGQELPRSAYVAHAHEDLRRILKSSNIVDSSE